MRALTIEELELVGGGTEQVSVTAYRNGNSGYFTWNGDYYSYGSDGGVAAAPSDAAVVAITAGALAPTVLETGGLTAAIIEGAGLGAFAGPIGAALGALLAFGTGYEVYINLPHTPAPTNAP
jgi:hypothetical protein